MLERFSDDGRKVVDRAGEEAHRFRHARIGTEHLLLGILAARDSSAGRAVLAAGATADGCRSKIEEAVGASTAATELTFTDRARRALERADRLSLRRRDAHVEPEHILLSVLDVEGRAGQVLRGLGVDVPLLRDTVASTMEKAIEPHTEPPPASSASPVCAGCGKALAATLSHQVLGSRDRDGVHRDFVVAFCSSCGATLGVSPDGPRPRRSG